MRENFLKVLPAYFGSLVPFIYYLVLRRIEAPFNLKKGIITLSGLSLPPLDELGGTSFTTPLFVYLVVLLAFRELKIPCVDRNNNDFGLRIIY